MSELFFLSLQLHPFLQNIHFNSTTMDDVHFNEDKVLVASYDIVNLVVVPNETALRENIGLLDVLSPSGPKLTIDERAIVWPGGLNQVRN